MEIRFQGKVALVRGLHWLGCRFPLPGPPTPVVDPEQLPDSPDVVVAPSRIPGAGLGVFARRPFAEGEVVCVYTGVPLSTIQALRTPDWRYLVGLGTDRAGRRIWIDARPLPDVLARYVNHSFDPAQRNLRTEVRPDERTWVMTAGRPIEAGEELHCDYGRLHWHAFDRALLPAHRRSRERVLQEGPGRRIVVEPGGTVRKTFPGGPESVASEELARLSLFATALAGVPGATCPQPLGPVRDPAPGYRMSWIDGEELWAHLRRPVPRHELERIGRTIAAALVAYVDAVGEPYTDLKLGNVLVAPGGELGFCDVGLPDGEVPPLRPEGALEGSVGNLLASLLFDSARPGWFWHRRVHRQSAVLAAVLVTALADAGRPLDGATLQAATAQAYRRTTFDRRSPLRTAWYATAGRLVAGRVRTAVGVLGPAPYHRD